MPKFSQCERVGSPPSVHTFQPSRIWSNAVVNSATVLFLPVIDLISISDSTVALKSSHSLKSANTSIIDDDMSLTRARHRFKQTCLPILCMKSINMVSNSQLTLAPFFLQIFLSSTQASLGFPSGPLP
ncbi:hypothetical protein G6F56_008452 [Rhizopus delemar]|nr:hypothetical protein G6F56_008452 [Rhizopus delemar]